jgi:hypothetical protein
LLKGRAGDRVIAEVRGRRLDSPLDSVLELTDSAGKRLAFNDDSADKADALKTHAADSLIDVTLPADGTYFLRLGDARNAGGLEYAYRLRVSPPQPDFELRVTPSCLNAQARQFTPFTVHAFRRDGFSGEIALSLTDLPEGFVLDGGTIPAGQDHVPVTLLAPPMAWEEPIRFGVEGRATIAGREVVRTAEPADAMTQAFAYEHLVPADELNVVVVDWSRGRKRAARAVGPDPSARPPQPAAFPRPMTLAADTPVKIPVGGSVELQVMMPYVSAAGPVQVELSDPPEGIGIDRISRLDKGVTILLRCDAGRAKPGLEGNLIAQASQLRTITDKEGKTREYRSVLGALPAIPFEIVEPHPVP